MNPPAVILLRHHARTRPVSRPTLHSTANEPSLFDMASTASPNAPLTPSRTAPSSTRRPRSRAHGTPLPAAIPTSTSPPSSNVRPPTLCALLTPRSIPRYATPTRSTHSHPFPPGVRSIDNMRKYVFPAGTPESILQAEADTFEVEIVNSAKQLGHQGIVYLPGAKSILDVAQQAPTKWAICTSGAFISLANQRMTHIIPATRTYASAALQSVHLALPDAFVTAGDVSNGKPWPEPYILGAAKCAVDPAHCQSHLFLSLCSPIPGIVFEDAPSGIRSGKAAGCKVYAHSSPHFPSDLPSIALLTSHSREAVEAAHPDLIVPDLSQ
ncbi:Haloacid dehalogenase-like hydrolase [Ceratobasidium theobromae]|uniref:Haloacid dehalogenase-like hydrolase n=1 Tax=Ceratobasidium theobromae TaxID=1582974 RepID=A0A5N5QPV5_9AGAM|nr:Haloacid dehalogenase-like hydrolase [Ceratobasidium theobromae]